jgi:hypothetical protein
VKRLREVRLIGAACAFAITQTISVARRDVPGLMHEQ